MFKRWVTYSEMREFVGLLLLKNNCLSVMIRSVIQQVISTNPIRDHCRNCDVFVK